MTVSTRMVPFFCECAAGYYSLYDDMYCVNKDECELGLHTCVTCEDTEGSFQCLCPPGYDGNSCYDVDECNLATHDCPIHTYCENTFGSFDCFCVTGFTERISEFATAEATMTDEGRYNASTTPPFSASSTPLTPIVSDALYADPTWWESGNETCVDVNECALGTHDCATVASCINSYGSFGCECWEGYVPGNSNGTNCADVDECENPNACIPASSCKNVPGTWECDCNIGFEGDGYICENCIQIEIHSASAAVGELLPSELLEVQAEFKLTCIESRSDYPLVYAWWGAVSLGVQQEWPLLEESMTQPLLRVPPFSLSHGAAFSLNYTVCVGGTFDGACESAFYFFQVLPEPPYALLGGTEMRVQQSQEFYLDGRATFDASGGNVTFTWTCLDITDPVYTYVCPSVLTDTDRFTVSTLDYVMIPGGILDPGMYSFLMEVSGIGGVSSSEMIVRVVEDSHDNAFNVQMGFVEPLVSPHWRIIIWASLLGTASCEGKVAWAQLEGPSVTPATITAHPMLPPSWTRLEDYDDTSVGSTCETLIAFDAYTFVGSSTKFTFRVSVVEAEGNQLWFGSEDPSAGNALPYADVSFSSTQTTFVHGTLSVSPDVGMALETGFELRAEGWSSDSRALWFQFGFIEPRHGAVVPLCAPQSLPVLVTTLPPVARDGKDGTDPRLQVVVVAYGDDFSISSQVFADVNVTWRLPVDQAWEDYAAEAFSFIAYRANWYEDPAATLNAVWAVQGYIAEIRETQSIAVNATAIADLRTTMILSFTTSRSLYAAVRGLTAQVVEHLSFALLAAVGGLNGDNALLSQEGVHLALQQVHSLVSELLGLAEESWLSPGVCESRLTEPALEALLNVVERCLTVHLSAFENVVQDSSDMEVIATALESAQLLALLSLKCNIPDDSPSCAMSTSSEIAIVGFRSLLSETEWRSGYGDSAGLITDAGEMVLQWSKLCPRNKRPVIPDDAAFLLPPPGLYFPDMNTTVSEMIDVVVTRFGENMFLLPASGLNGRVVDETRRASRYPQGLVGSAGGPFIDLSFFDYSTGEKLHPQPTEAPSHAVLRMGPETFDNQTLSEHSRHVECAVWRFAEDGTGNWDTESCIALPNPLPPDTVVSIPWTRVDEESEYSEGARYELIFQPGEDGRPLRALDLRNSWLVRPRESSAGCFGEFPGYLDSDGQRMRTFGVSTEPECAALLDWGKATNCSWDPVTQAFYGGGCVVSPSVACVCSQVGAIGAVIVENAESVLVAQEGERNEALNAYFLGVCVALSCAVLIIVAFWWENHCSSVIAKVLRSDNCGYHMSGRTETWAFLWFRRTPLPRPSGTPKGGRRKKSRGKTNSEDHDERSRLVSFGEGGSHIVTSMTEPLDDERISHNSDGEICVGKAGVGQMGSSMPSPHNVAQLQARGNVGECVPLSPSLEKIAKDEAPNSPTAGETSKTDHDFEAMLKKLGMEDIEETTITATTDAEKDKIVTMFLGLEDATNFRVRRIGEVIGEVPEWDEGAPPDTCRSVDDPNAPSRPTMPDQNAVDTSTLQVYEVSESQQEFAKARVEEGGIESSPDTTSAGALAQPVVRCTSTKEQPLQASSALKHSSHKQSSSPLSTMSHIIAPEGPSLRQSESPVGGIVLSPSVKSTVTETDTDASTESSVASPRLSMPERLSHSTKQASFDESTMERVYEISSTLVRSPEISRSLSPPLQQPSNGSGTECGLSYDARRSAVVGISSAFPLPLIDHGGAVHTRPRKEPCESEASPNNSVPADVERSGPEEETARIIAEAEAQVQAMEEAGELGHMSNPSDDDGLTDPNTTERTEHEEADSSDGSYASLSQNLSDDDEDIRPSLGASVSPSLRIQIDRVAGPSRGSTKPRLSHLAPPEDDNQSMYSAAESFMSFQTAEEELFSDDGLFLTIASAIGTSPAVVPPTQPQRSTAPRSIPSSSPNRLSPGPLALSSTLRVDKSIPLSPYTYEPSVSDDADAMAYASTPSGSEHSLSDDEQVPLSPMQSNVQPDHVTSTSAASTLPTFASRNRPRRSGRQSATVEAPALGTILEGSELSSELPSRAIPPPKSADGDVPRVWGKSSEDGDNKPVVAPVQPAVPNCADTEPQAPLHWDEDSPAMLPMESSDIHDILDTTSALLAVKREQVRLCGSPNASASRPALVPAASRTSRDSPLATPGSPKPIQSPVRQPQHSSSDAAVGFHPGSGGRVAVPALKADAALSKPAMPSSPHRASSPGSTGSKAYASPSIGPRSPSLIPGSHRWKLEDNGPSLSGRWTVHDDDPTLSDTPTKRVHKDSISSMLKPTVVPGIKPKTQSLLHAFRPRSVLGAGVSFLRSLYDTGAMCALEAGPWGGPNKVLQSLLKQKDRSGTVTADWVSAAFGIPRAKVYALIPTFTHGPCMTSKRIAEDRATVFGTAFVLACLHAFSVIEPFEVRQALVRATRMFSNCPWTADVPVDQNGRARCLADTGKAPGCADGGTASRDSPPQVSGTLRRKSTRLHLVYTPAGPSCPLPRPWPFADLFLRLSDILSSDALWRPGWSRRCQVWKLGFLQLEDGRWSLSVDVARAITGVIGPVTRSPSEGQGVHDELNNLFVDTQSEDAVSRVEKKYNLCDSASAQSDSEASSSSASSHLLSGPPGDSKLKDLRSLRSSSRRTTAVKVRSNSSTANDFSAVDTDQATLSLGEGNKEGRSRNSSGGRLENLEYITFCQGVDAAPIVSYLHDVVLDSQEDDPLDLVDDSLSLHHLLDSDAHRRRVSERRGRSGLLSSLADKLRKAVRPGVHTDRSPNTALATAAGASSRKGRHGQGTISPDLLSNHQVTPPKLRPPAAGSMFFRRGAAHTDDNPEASETAMYPHLQRYAPYERCKDMRLPDDPVGQDEHPYPSAADHNETELGYVLPVSAGKPASLLVPMLRMEVEQPPEAEDPQSEKPAEERLSSEEKTLPVNRAGYTVYRDKSYRAILAEMPQSIAGLASHMDRLDAWTTALVLAVLERRRMEETSPFRSRYFAGSSDVHLHWNPFHESYKAGWWEDTDAEKRGHAWLEANVIASTQLLEMARMALTTLTEGPVGKASESARRDLDNSEGSFSPGLLDDDDDDDWRPMLNTSSQGASAAPSEAVGLHAITPAATVTAVLTEVLTGIRKGLWPRPIPGADRLVCLVAGMFGAAFANRAMLAFVARDCCHRIEEDLCTDRYVDTLCPHNVDDAPICSTLRTSYEEYECRAIAPFTDDAGEDWDKKLLLGALAGAVVAGLLAETLVWHLLRLRRGFLDRWRKPPKALAAGVYLTSKRLRRLTIFIHFLLGLLFMFSGIGAIFCDVLFYEAASASFYEDATMSISGCLLAYLGLQLVLPFLRWMLVALPLDAFGQNGSDWKTWRAELAMLHRWEKPLAAPQAQKRSEPTAIKLIIDDSPRLP
eukprot:Rmarinus@m.20600